jgi:uncharacterized protein with beta-barrel porin domain
MSPYEEELQKRIEQGQEDRNTGVDARAYQEIFRALKKDPGYSLPGNFAERTAGKVLQEKSAASSDALWFGIGIFLLTVSLLVALFFSGFSLNFGFLEGMTDYKGLLVFGILFVAFLNWLDKKLLKPV